MRYQTSTSNSSHLSVTLYHGLPLLVFRQIAEPVELPNSLSEMTSIMPRHRATNSQSPRSSEPHVLRLIRKLPGILGTL